MNKRNNQGWNLRGRNAFAQLCRRVKDDRTANGAAFDLQFSQYVRDVYRTEKKKEGNKDNDEKQEEEFDEFAFLDADGSYCPSKVLQSTNWTKE